MCITGYSNEGRYYFILKDTGQGIPEEIIDQVTDEFLREMSLEILGI